MASRITFSRNYAHTLYRALGTRVKNDKKRSKNRCSCDEIVGYSFFIVFYVYSYCPSKYICLYGLSVEYILESNASNRINDERTVEHNYG